MDAFNVYATTYWLMLIYNHDIVQVGSLMGTLV